MDHRQQRSGSHRYDTPDLSDWQARFRLCRVQREYRNGGVTLPIDPLLS